MLVKSEQRIQRFFSPLIIGYGVIVLLVLAFIFYVAFSKTTIIVTLAQSADTATFSYTAKELAGEVITTPVSHQIEFTDYEGESEDAIARGNVSIINNYSTDQPLVKTTRLLSEDGVLFRTDETVTVPAGGSVTVSVYADQVGASGNIEPTKFEIVALWDGLKDNIYAESATAMTGGIIKRVTLTDTLAEQAELQATTELPRAAAADLQTKTTNGTVDPTLVMLEETTTSVNPAIGETSNTISATTTTTASTIVFDPAALTTLISADYPTGDITKLTYKLEKNNDDILVITGSVPLPINEPSLNFIRRADLTNKTPQQIQDALLAYDQVTAVVVQITPFWATRSPSLEQQIHLEMVTDQSTSNE